VTCLRVATLGGTERIISGTRGGMVAVLNAAGETEAYATLGADIRSMDIAGDDRQVVVGLEDGRTVALTF